MVRTGETWQTQLASLPVGRFLSETTWELLGKYVKTGHQAQRSYRLLEFFKTIDWLPLDEIEPNPIEQLDKEARQQIYREIRAYFSDKQSKRQARKSQRENYRLRVFEYFRTQVSQADKELLEHLRDYELERIGMDVNWRHYFWFTTFRQIDAFINKSPEERRQLIARFMQDVELHYKNAQRLREGTYAQYYWGDGFESAGETFDEWANRQAWQNPHHRQENSHQSNRRYYYRPGVAQTASSTLQQAFACLQLSPLATLSEVRKQFRQLTLQHHPDMPGGSEEKMKALLDAYNLVKRAVSQRQQQSG